MNAKAVDIKKEEKTQQQVTGTKLFMQDNRSSAIAQLQLQKIMKPENRTSLQHSKNNTGLPDTLKTGIENLSGIAMDDVSVHYNSPEPAQLQAHAYAQGTDIHVAPGQEKHLPHEAWHVVQQKQGRVNPTTQLKQGVSINNDEQLEKEADEMGEKASNTTRNNVHSGNIQLVKTTPAPKPVQRKVGVEYETKWKVSGDEDEQHKKRILDGAGWHIESDDNYLEFVVDPPATSPNGLKNKSAAMANKAKEIRNKVGGSASKPATEAIGGGVKDMFSDKKVIKSDADPAMSAKAQFTFGISMEALTGFLNKISSGDLPKGDYSEAAQKFNFKKDNPETNREFVGSVLKKDVSNSDTYRKKLTDLADGQSSEMKGFLSYIGFYIGSMQKNITEKVGFSTFTKASRVAFLAQEILKNKNSDATIEEFALQIKYTEADATELYAEADVEIDKKINTFIDEDFEKLKNYHGKRVKEVNSPKYYFSLMNRSGFDKMFLALKQGDQLWFQTNIDEAIAAIGFKPDQKLFSTPYTYAKKDNEGSTTEVGFSHGPTIKEWFTSIAQSAPQTRDLLSPPKEFIKPNGQPDPEQSMGQLGLIDNTTIKQYEITKEKKPIDKEKTKDVYTAKEKQAKAVKLVVIELRQWGDWIKPEGWAEHSYDMAFLYDQIAPGHLDSDFELELVELQNQIAELQAKKRKDTGGSKSKKQHIQNYNRGINQQIANINYEISELRKKYKK